MRNWTDIELSNITVNLDNRRIPLNSAERREKEEGGTYPYVGANNIQGYINEYIFNEKILCIAEDGGSWGKNKTCAVIVNEKCWVNNHAHVLTSNGKVELEFLKYYLNFTDLSLHINGATRGKLTKKSLNSIKIPLPPLEEQKKIADILDVADSIRQKDQQLVEHYDRLSQSLFLEMFGDPVTNPKNWEISKLGENLLEAVGGKSVSGTERALKEGETAVIKISSVTTGVFNPNEYKVVEKNDIPAVLVSPCYGDLLFSRANTRELVGAVCIVKQDHENLFLPDKIWRLDLNKSHLSNYYIQFLLTHDGFRENIRKVATGTSGSMLNVSKAKLKSLLVPMPFIALQNNFTEQIIKIEKQKELAQQSLKKSDELFNSLLQKAFKGELTAS